MEDYQLRVIKEAEELDSKISKLDVYLESINQGDSLLVEQINAMEDYSLILHKRIATFKKD
jgi:hypothetical protein